MSIAAENALLAAARNGDERAFGSLTQPYARELHVHCYRMLGSIHDAEDALQETFIRAWRHLGRFEGRSSLRAWLYSIATNVCLTLADRRSRNPVPIPPHPVGAAAEPAEIAHLTPYPDALLDELRDTSTPEARYELQESVQLAFLAAIQLLPPRQRAVLILRDVLGWSAREVAELLDSTVASANSALHRARSALEERRGATWSHPSPDVAASLVRRYMAAWESVDIDALAGLLKHDAVMTMPPQPVLYRGRDAIADFFATIPAGGALDQIRLVPTRANGQPAVAAYGEWPGEPGYRAYGIMVLTLDGDEIASITGFTDAALFPLFGLPTSLD